MGIFADWVKNKLMEGMNFQNVIYLFRGIGMPNKFDRIGRWWSTNPYYSLRYGGLKEGQVFVAQITKPELEQGLANDSIVDVTQDEYPNYVFRNFDPPQARPMTADEIMKFRQLSGDLDKEEPKRIGMMSMPQMFKQLWGQDAINAAYTVYGS